MVRWNSSMGPIERIRELAFSLRSNIANGGSSDGWEPPSRSKLSRWAKDLDEIANLVEQELADERKLVEVASEWSIREHRPP